MQYKVKSIWTQQLHTYEVLLPVLPISFLKYCNQATELSGYLTSDIKS